MKIPEILQSLCSLYDQIDREANRLAAVHAGRLHCRPGCVDCCIDGISINEVEALNIRHFFGDVVNKGTPHPDGACAFLDRSNKCRIYDQRPYVCRTQGLPLHWIEERDGKTVALRDICRLNDQGKPIEQLPENECWEIGPIEEELAKLQIAYNKGLMKRVQLRELFH